MCSQQTLNTKMETVHISETVSIMHWSTQTRIWIQKRSSFDGKFDSKHDRLQCNGLQCNEMQLNWIVFVLVLMLSDVWIEDWPFWKLSSTCFLWVHSISCYDIILFMWYLCCRNQHLEDSIESKNFAEERWKWHGIKRLCNVKCWGERTYQGEYGLMQHEKQRIQCEIRSQKFQIVCIFIVAHFSGGSFRSPNRMKFNQTHIRHPNVISCLAQFVERQYNSKNQKYWMIDDRKRSWRCRCKSCSNYFLSFDKMKID